MTALLIASGVLQIFDPKAIETPKTAVCVGFLVGYFSDMAIGKLSEVAKTLFGPAKEARASRTTTPTRRSASNHSSPSNPAATPPSGEDTRGKGPSSSS